MEVHSQLGDDVRIIGVPGLSDRQAFENFVQSHGAESIEHIDDPDGELWDRFGVSQHATYVFVNDDGSSQRVNYGSLPSDVEDLIAR